MMPGMPAAPARVAVQIQPQHAEYADIRRLCATLEDIGVDVIFNLDHCFPLNGDPDGRHFECWSMLGAWAEATERVEIGALVTCSAYRNANLLADMARTVDHISARAGEGRLILGIGSGWFERDFDEYGYEFGTAGGRLDALEQDLAVIKDRWTRLNPPPTRRIPILIGGGGERKTLRIVAEHATIWHSFGNPTTIARKHEVLDEWCARVGRDPEAITRSAGVAPSPGRYAEQVASYSTNAQAFYDVGTRLFTIGLSGERYGDLDKVRELVAWRDDVNR
jgi:probable F420-dependent oxidoreductase